MRREMRQLVETDQRDLSALPVVDSGFELQVRKSSASPLSACEMPASASAIWSASRRSDGVPAGRAISARTAAWRRRGEEVRFATDSPVEEGGFEPSVPRSPVEDSIFSRPPRKPATKKPAR
jgi:hypothetical protein